MSRFLSAILTALIFFVSTAQAEFYEKDQLYIYKIRPYSEVLSSKEIVEFTAKISHVALVSVMESMVEHKIFPESIASVQDIERLRKANDEVETLVAYLNKLIQEQRAEKSRFTLPDLLPDAFLVFGGKKLSLNIGAGVAGAVSLGVVMMPVFVEKYSIRTGQLEDEYFSVKMGIVGWANGDAGVAVGGGSALQVGIGAIWDLNDSFVNPEQFWGAGLGTSWSPLVLGAGINAKVGFVSNWDMPGWVDFAYLTAGMELGATIEVSAPKASFTSFFSGAKIMGLLESSQRKAFETALKDMGKRVDEVIIEIRKNEEERILREKELHLQNNP